MVDIRIKDLPTNNAPSKSQYVPTDLASAQKLTIEDLVYTGRPTASQAEAEAGVNAENAMTPLTTKQAIDAQSVPFTAIGTTIQPYSDSLTTLSGVAPLAAGVSILGMSLGADVRNFLDTAPYVATRTAAKALDTTKDTTLILTEAGREGIFNWQTGNFSTHITADTTGAIYLKADAIASTVGAWVRLHDGAFDVRWFGAVADGVTDDTAAFQAAANMAAFRDATTPSRLRIQPFKYLVTDSTNFSQTGGRRWEIVGGNGIASAEIVVAYHGYGTAAKTGAVFQFGNPASPSYQTSLAINGIQFSRQNSTFRAPIAIQGASIAQSRIDNITSGSWNNIAVSLITPQNVRGYNWDLFGGGVSFGYKDASAVTVTQSGATLTASGSIFSASDIGKTVAIWGSGSSTYRRQAVIIAYSSPTVVTVAKAVTDATARRLIFGSPFASMAASGFTLTADASCFTTDHVGLTIYVKGAGVNGGLLRTKIVGWTSGTTVTVDIAATTAVTQAEFGVPSVEVYSEPTFGNGASDVRLSCIEIEDHNGIGLCVYDADLFHFEGKIHSEQTINVFDDYSISPIWADRWSGTFTGDFDGQYIGQHRSYFTNQTKTLHIPLLQTRSAIDEVLAYIGPRASGFLGALVVFGDVAVSGTSTSANIVGDMVVDANIGSGTPGCALDGTWSLSTVNKNTVFLGRGVYSDNNGNLSASTIAFDGGTTNKLSTYVIRSAWTPVIADAASGGSVATGTFGGTYERVGNQVSICADCRSINTTGMTAGNIVYLRGFPIPVAGGINNRYTATVRVDNVTFSGYLTAYTDNTDTYFIFYQNISGAASTALTVAGLASGTANIYVSCNYVA